MGAYADLLKQKRHIAITMAVFTVLNIVAAFLWLTEMRAPWAPSPNMAPVQTADALLTIERPWLKSKSSQFAGTAGDAEDPPKPKPKRWSRPEKATPAVAETAEKPVTDKPAVEKPVAEKTVTEKPAPAQKATLAVTECKQWGPLLLDDAARVQTALGGWPGRIEKKSVGEIQGYMVYMPADKLNGVQGMLALKEKGVSDLFVMQSPPTLKGGASLGIFKTREAAEAHLANLQKKGIEGLQMAPREGLSKTVFILRGTPEQMRQLGTIQKDTRRGSLSACE